MDSCEILRHIKEFIADKDRHILILGSMQTETRDRWTREILQYQKDSRCFSLSNRVRNNIELHRNMKSDSLYASIYSLNRSESDSDTQDQPQTLLAHSAPSNSRGSETEEQDEVMQRIVPIKDVSVDIAPNTSLIILDAHLISRSLVQSEFLRFGSGRLLEDLFKSTRQVKNTRYIFIGDPYSMSIGKTTDNALDKETVQTISQISAEGCNKYEEALDTIACTNARDILRFSLARSIEQQTFNIIPYIYDTETLLPITQEGIQSLMCEWFTGCDNPREFDNKILLYRNQDCLSTNLYIKRYYKKNGENLAIGDLLLLDNSSNLLSEEDPHDKPIDETNILSSGSYIRIKSVDTEEQKHIKIKGYKEPIRLTFIPVDIETEEKRSYKALILENYLHGASELSKEENSAFVVLMKQRQKQFEQKEQLDFSRSEEYKKLVDSSDFKGLTSEEQEAIRDLVIGEQGVKTSQHARSLLAKCRRQYTHRISRLFRERDPYFNSLRAKYGWAITVHKALGQSFGEVVLSGFRKEGEGLDCEAYFRWLYTGLTVSRKVHLYKAQTLHPLYRCEIIVKSTPYGAPAKEIRRDTYDTPKQYQQLLQGISNPSLCFVIVELSEQLRLQHIMPLVCRKYSEYLYKVEYRGPQTTSAKGEVVSIYVGGVSKGYAVTSIKVEHADTIQVKEEIETILSRLWSKSNRKNSVSQIEEHSFRKDIYGLWAQKLQDVGLSLELRASYLYEDVLDIVQDAELRASLKTWYNSKGFVSRLEIYTTDSVLGRELEMLIRNSYNI